MKPLIALGSGTSCGSASAREAGLLFQSTPPSPSPFRDTPAWRTVFNAMLLQPSVQGSAAQNTTRFGTPKFSGRTDGNNPPH